MSFQNDPVKIRQSLKVKAMDLLARRDYSEKELREKLIQRFAQVADLDRDALNDAIEEVVQFAQEKKWLASPEETAQRVAESLHQRHKGIHYINAYLEQKGLPTVSRDAEHEHQKALAALRNKYDLQITTREHQARIARFLSSRGFDSETVRKVLNEKF